MKKLQLTAVLILLWTAGYAQVGVRAGYVISNWDGLIFDSGQEITTVNGFSLGVYAHAPLNPIIVFEPGIFITPKGTHMSGGPFPEPVSNRSIYVDVPIMVKMYIGGGGFHINAGPQFSYLIWNKAISESGEEIDTIGEFSRWDVAASIGLAYDFKFGMNIGTSFDLSATQILLFNDYLEWSEARNRVIRFSLGYTFQ
jgi:hypothetical protein